MVRGLKIENCTREILAIKYAL